VADRLLAVADRGGELPSPNLSPRRAHWRRESMRPYAHRCPLRARRRRLAIANWPRLRLPRQARGLHATKKLRRNVFRARRALDRRLLSATRRSSARVIATRAQSSSTFESLSKNPAGDLPPETIATPRAAIAERRRSAAQSARSCASPPPSAKWRRCRSGWIIHIPHSRSARHVRSRRRTRWAPMCRRHRGAAAPGTAATHRESDR
jgi:hypothetical protein